MAELIRQQSCVQGYGQPTSTKPNVNNSLKNQKKKPKRQSKGITLDTLVWCWNFSSPSWKQFLWVFHSLKNFHISSFKTLIFIHITSTEGRETFAKTEEKIFRTFFQLKKFITAFQATHSSLYFKHPLVTPSAFD